MRSLCHKKYIICPLFIGTLLFAILILSFVSIKNWEKNFILQRFALDAQERTLAIQREIDTNLEILTSIYGFYEASNYVDRQEFKIFTGPLLAKHPSIKAVEWAPIVRNTDRNSHENAIQKEGVSSYAISEFSPKKEFEIAKDRPFYFPVKYSLPERDKQLILGFDLYSGAEQRKAIETAIKTTKITATPPIKILHEIDTPDGVLIFLPVFKKDAQIRTFQSRKDNIAGLLVAVFHPKDIVIKALSFLGQKTIDVQLVEREIDGKENIFYEHIASNQNKLIKTAKSTQTKKLHEYAGNQEIPVGGRIWLIRCIPTSNYFSSHQTTLPYVILIFGAVFILLAVFSLFKLLDRSKQVEELVQKRTLELNEANQKLQKQAFAAKLFHEPTTVASEVGSFEKALKKCLAIICKLTHWPVGHAYLTSKDDKNLLLPSDLWYLDSKNDYSEFQSVTRATKFPIGKGLPGRILQTGKAAWIENVQTDENFPRNKKSTNLGVKGAFGLPIKLNQQTVAVLEFFTTKEMALNEDLLAAISNVSKQLSRVFERKDHAEKLKIAKEIAEDASRSKSEFMANMSHELRTPLNSVIGFANILLKNKSKNLNESDTNYLNRILKSGKHLLCLINEILDLSKIEANKMEVNSESFDLHPVIEEVIQQYDILAQEKGVQIIQNIPESLVPITADKFKLKQVIINLLSNAIKFTEHGKITVQIQTFPNSNLMKQMNIIDTGVGIPFDQIQNIFKPFTQADGSTKRKFGGTGLGLSISKAYLEMMGFALKVISSDGRGSTFSIHCPSTRSKENNQQNQSSQSQESRVSGKESHASNNLVLVIDDESDSRVLMTQTLEELGCEVITANSGPQGIKMAKEFKPKFITLDLMMPNMSGFEVFKILKNDPDVQDIPVIVVSIVATENKKNLMGVYDTINKPITRENMESALGNILLHKNARVLILEDDDACHQVISYYLQEEQYQTVWAKNGREGIEAIKVGKPDLIILDLMMPVMDGYSFLEVLQKSPEWKDIPVVVVTAKDLSKEDITELGRDVADIFHKGEDLEIDLKNTVRQLLQDKNDNHANSKLVH